MPAIYKTAKLLEKIKYAKNFQDMYIYLLIFYIKKIKTIIINHRCYINARNLIINRSYSKSILSQNCLLHLLDCFAKQNMQYEEISRSFKPINLMVDEAAMSFVQNKE